MLTTILPRSEKRLQNDIFGLKNFVGEIIVFLFAHAYVAVYLYDDTYKDQFCK